ncbi:DEAD/DEAH box helicase [Roseiconus lacunae]|uniref:DEAD/DEAH box helicase n=1 Tax=Roseiconus lacunae TaxID=2605694 RepID=UPI00308691E2|nr:DEAD/DEAH box helicase [Stieleria sp. HD01]
MMLSEAVQDQFHNVDRLAGISIKMLESVSIEQAGTEGVLACVGGRSPHAVLLDFTELAEGWLGGYCTCEAFKSGSNCKHLWALMTKVDLLYESPFGDVLTTDLLIDSIEPDQWSCGRPLRKLIGSQSNGSMHANGVLTKPDATRSDWQQQLQRVSPQSHHSDENALGLPEAFVPASFQAKQTWFVLSTSDPINQDSLRLTAMISTRKNDGDWSRPMGRAMTNEHLAELPDPAERRVFEMLTPIEEEQRYYRYSYQPVEYRQFSVSPNSLCETLTSLFHTGRFAWKLGDSKTIFEDGRPISHLAVDASSKLRIAVRRDPDVESQIIIKPELVVPEFGLFSTRDVIWSSTIGCLLLSLQHHDADQNCSEVSETAVGDGQTDDRELGDQFATCLATLSPDSIDLLKSWGASKAIVAPREDLEDVIQVLSQRFINIDLDLDPEFGIETVQPTPKPMCALTQLEHRSSSYRVSFKASYPDRELLFDAATQWWYEAEEKRLIRRNVAAEQELISKIDFDQLPLRCDDGYQSNVTLAPSDFLRFVETMQNAGWEINAQGAPLRQASNFRASVTTSDVDWFDLDGEVEFNEQSVALPTLLQAIGNGQQTIQLDDGSVGMIPIQWLSKFGGIEKSAESVDDKLRFHRSQGLMLDLLLSEVEDVDFDRNYLKFLKQIKSFTGIKAANSVKSFRGDLREYQRLGLGWLKFLNQLGCGGCLADDMGLGKTIQVLAMLESRRKRRTGKDEIRKPSIVVVPKSLVFNWIEETQKFAPKLIIRNHTGPERKLDWDAFLANPQSADVVLTTYQTMRIDIEKLRQLDYDYAILDEAQAIKNPKSQVAKASRILRAEHRLAMTGTPVENHLGDLWSIFDFLNPGMLGRTPTTRQLPDMQDDSEREQVRLISQSLRPFILRRTKSEVLTELPEKIEQTLACSMSPKHQKLYNELRDHFRMMLSQKVEEVGLKKAKIHVLAALMRLRQAACDPRLVDPNSKVRGSKVEELIERLDELMQEGRKTLVFSQFTSLLHLVKKDLRAKGWDYEYLDGQTTSREAKVKRFQSDDDCKLFLISLKAGGTGLNLTSAESVFILDPWWNPATEAQAIDRAHRMGQTRCVNAYRMICKDTIEEKIIELKRSKQQLADAIIGEDKSLISQLTADDLHALLV